MARAPRSTSKPSRSEGSAPRASRARSAAAAVREAAEAAEAATEPAAETVAEAAAPTEAVTEAAVEAASEAVAEAPSEAPSKPVEPARISMDAAAEAPGFDTADAALRSTGALLDGCGRSATRAFELAQAAAVLSLDLTREIAEARSPSDLAEAQVRYASACTRVAMDAVQNAVDLSASTVTAAWAPITAGAGNVAGLFGMRIRA